MRKMNIKYMLFFLLYQHLLVLFYIRKILEMCCINQENFKFKIVFKFTFLKHLLYFIYIIYLHFYFSSPFIHTYSFIYYKYIHSISNYFYYKLKQNL